MDDIAPDDITISEDEVEEESGTHISPQVCCDIAILIICFWVMSRQYHKLSSAILCTLLNPMSLPDYDFEF